MPAAVATVEELERVRGGVAAVGRVSAEVARKQHERIVELERRVEELGAMVGELYIGDRAGQG